MSKPVVWKKFPKVPKGNAKLISAAHWQAIVDTAEPPGVKPLPLLNLYIQATNPTVMDLRIKSYVTEDSGGIDFMVFQLRRDGHDIRVTPAVDGNHLYKLHSETLLAPLPKPGFDVEVVVHCETRDDIFVTFGDDFNGSDALRESIIDSALGWVFANTTPAVAQA